MGCHFYIISKDWSRHGDFSGYECILAFLKLPYQLAKRFFIPYRLIKFFAINTQLKNYQSNTVIKEWFILWQIFKRKTVHILYGDMDFYYLHYLKRFPFNLRQNTLIATFHHPPYELEKRLNYNRIKVLGALDKIIVMGPNQKAFLQQYTNAIIKFIPHGINLDYFTYDKEHSRQNQILLIGVSHRNHSRNIAIINAVNTQIETKFIVLTTHQNAKLYRSLDNVSVITENISDNELLGYYQDSKGLLLSLIDCTASNSILEALACGCPIITNNVGAVRDYIPENTGIPVFETDDINDSVSYIVKLLKEDEFLKIISATQRKLAKKYDWKVIAKTTEDFILS